MRAKRRIALYGGTFDPVHVGHLEIARRVSQLFEIGKVLFIPAQMAPHKVRRPVTGAIHRYAMLALATQDNPNLAISTFELDAPDRRYTVETIQHFQEKLGDDTGLFFIMGSDSWSEITTWREWERLLKMTNHVVVTRPGYEPSTTHVGTIAERIVDLRSLECDDSSPLSPRSERATFTKAATSRRTPKIFFTDVVMNDVSATNIRRIAREGRTEKLAGSVPGPVLEYIEKYGIYRNSNEVKFNN